MTWRALRPFVLPILRAVVSSSAPLFLKPCCRMMFWQMFAIRRRLAGKRARWATWRFRVLRDRCAALRDESCSAAEAADKVLAALLGQGHRFARELLEAAPERRREVLELLGPEARAQLLGGH